MREIKFRGKDLSTGEWAYGDLHTLCDHPHIHTETTSFPFAGKRSFIDPETIGQFTGLKDKNGTAIYEGDILSIASESNKPFGVVMWHKEGYFCVEEKLSASEPSDHISIGKLLRVAIFEFEVIGNIHDNPELIKDYYDGKEKEQKQAY